MANLVIIVCAFLLLLQMSVAGTIAPSHDASHNAFATDVFKVIANGKADENIIYSPASIQSCLTLAFIGAEGKTADELRSGLKLGALDKDQIAKDYGNFLKTEFKTSTNPEDPILKMANRIYVNKELTIAPKFNEIAKSYFNSEAEQVNFADSSASVKQINTWVEQQTENKIQNLLQNDAVDAQTSSVLINAIYFKGKWAIPFTPELTRKSDFHLSAKHKSQVDTMSQDDKFRYADLTDFDAKALELPYKNSDLSMLIILPNKLDGLIELENKLSKIDLNLLSQKMRTEDVDVQLPKFKIEFDVDLKEPLEKLGITQLFSDQSNLSGLFTNAGQQKVSNAKHKAYLAVNEAGSEAAAATFLKIVPMSLNLNQKHFYANHPFVFAIRNSKAVFFAGHVSKL